MRLDPGLVRAHAGKPDARAEGRTGRSADVGKAKAVRVGLLGAALLAVWLATLNAQEHAQASPTVWAALDVVAHGAAAGLCTVWLLPGFGFEPLVWGVGAGTLIDLDHVVAARSLDPLQMMSLGARPPTHSLLAALILGVLVACFRGHICGYAAAVGVVAHLLGDAIELAGVPLLVPFVADPSIHVSETTQLLVMLAMALVSTALSLSTRAGRHAWPHTNSVE